MYKPALSGRLIGSGSLAGNVVNAHSYIDVALLEMFWPLSVKESGSVKNSWPMYSRKPFKLFGQSKIVWPTQ